MEKRLLLDLQLIASGSVPGPGPGEAAASGGGQAAPPMRRLQQAPAIALVLGRGFAQFLQLTIQTR